MQNATLAGAIAIGSSANLMVQPFGAIIIGSIAGIVSVIGYRYLQPFLLRKARLHDTCGVQNLHGLAGLIGGICSVIIVFVVNEDYYGET